MTSSSKQPTKEARQSFGAPTSIKKEKIRHFPDPTFYTKVNKDLTPANQKIVEDTIQEPKKNYQSPLKIS